MESEKSTPKKFTFFTDLLPLFITAKLIYEVNYENFLKE